MTMIEQMKATCSTKDFVKYLIGETHYNLNDGISIPGVVRKFTDDEYALINGVIELIKRKIDRYMD